MQIPRQLRAGGGIMTLEEPRQGFFLGKIVKKAKRAVKKVVKSPIGKAALLAGGAYLAGGFMPGGGGLTDSPEQNIGKIEVKLDSADDGDNQLDLSNTNTAFLFAGSYTTFQGMLKYCCIKH